MAYLDSWHRLVNLSFVFLQKDTIYFMLILFRDIWPTSQDIRYQGAVWVLQAMHSGWNGPFW